MINKLASKKVLAITLGVSLMSMVSLSVLKSDLGSHRVSAHNLVNGLGICSQRLAQSFTTLMMGKFNGGYLTESFKASTTDCFEDFASETATTLDQNKQLTKLSSKLLSDVHWFNKKLERTTKLAKEETIELNDSSVVRKYESLEELRSSIEEKLFSVIGSLGTQNMWASLGFFFSVIITMLSFIGLFVWDHRDRRAVRDLENMSQELADEAIEASQVERIIERLGKNAGLEHTAETLSRYHSELLEENFDLKQSAFKSTPIKEVEESATTVDVAQVTHFENSTPVDLDDVINMVLENVQGEAFKSGVMIDTDIATDLIIESNDEALEQVIYNTIMFGLERSQSHNKGRKVHLRANQLGPKVYWKFKIDNYQLTKEEMNFINGSSEIDASMMSLNLILMVELLKNACANISVKNKSSHSAEIEFLFNKSIAAGGSQAATKSVVKGSKKEIMQMLSEQSM